MSSLTLPEDNTPLGRQFQLKIVNQLHADDIGNTCRENTLITMMGKALYAKRKDRKVTMANMRRLGSLLQKLRIAGHDASLTGEDMFDRKKFRHLEDAIERLTSKEDSHSINAGLKLGIGYLLKKVLKS